MRCATLPISRPAPAASTQPETMVNCSFVSARSQPVPTSARESGHPEANYNSRTSPSADFIACAAERAIFLYSPGA